MVGSVKTPTTRSGLRGPSRRQVLGAGVAAAAITRFPYVSRGLAAQTLKFWQFYAPGGGVPSQDKWYEDVVKAWNDSHEVKVELVYVPNNAYMDGTKLPTAFASGAGPDLFIISPGDFLRYYNGGVLLDLTPFMEQSARDDFLPSVIANRMVDGKIYGLPYEVEPMAMYYSVDAFNEVGLTEKDVPKDLGGTSLRGEETDQSEALRRPVRDQSRLLSELHLVSLPVGGWRGLSD